MKVLFSTCSHAAYMQPPQLSDDQVNCGPDWPDQRGDDGRYLSLSTPVGEYDLALIAERLGADQQPDVVVCLVDASKRNMPRNLARFSCPKVLLMADTHHMQSPVETMLNYIASEGFDRHIILYCRHHAVFFRSAGVKNIFWFPGLTFPHSDVSVQSARSTAPRQQYLAFVGQTGDSHPRRVRLLRSLQKAGLPVATQQIHQNIALRFYGASAMALNSSLNGDLNLRVFEILSSGATLITDRLSDASGMGNILSEGRECLLYSSSAELVDKVSKCVANPKEAESIGKAGSDWFDKNFNQMRRRKVFESIVFDGKATPEFEFSEKERSFFIFPERRNHFKQVLTQYENVQELHRVNEIVNISLNQQDPNQETIAAMFLTLPRVKLDLNG